MPTGLIFTRGVRHIPIGDVRSTVLCRTPRELPAFSTQVRDHHIEDSLLSAAGRKVRPQVRIDLLCRIADATSGPTGARD